MPRLPPLVVIGRRHLFREDLTKRPESEIFNDPKAALIHIQPPEPMAMLKPTLFKEQAVTVCTSVWGMENRARLESQRPTA